MAGRDREVRWLQALGGFGTTEEASLVNLEKCLGMLRTKEELGVTTSLFVGSFMHLFIHIRSCRELLRFAG